MIDRILWKKLLHGENSERGVLAETLRARLVDEDFGFLLTMLASTDSDANESALLVLDAGAVPTDPAIAGRLASEVSRLVRARYPDGVVGSTALRLWRMVDRVAADTFIETEVDFGTLTGIAGSRAVLDLSVSRGPHALDRLRELAERSDEIGAESRRRLGLLAPSDEHMDALRRNWLLERSVEALTALYYAFGTRIAWGRTTKKQIIDMFGDPDSRDTVTIWYSPNPGFAVSYQFDDKGRVISSHLT